MTHHCGPTLQGVFAPTHFPERHYPPYRGDGSPPPQLRVMPNFSPGEETLFMVMGLTADQRVALWSTAAERGVTCAEMLVSHLVAIGIIPGTPAALPPFTPEQGQWKKGPRT